MVHPDGSAGIWPGSDIRDQPLATRDAPDAQMQREVLMWESRVKAVQIDEAEQLRLMHRWRRMLAGKGNERSIDPTSIPDGVFIEAQKVNTNLIYSTFASALPLIYDSVADVMVSPSRSVDPIHYEMARKFSETATILLKHYFVDEAMLKARMRALARSTMTYGLGWLKMAWAREYESQPILKMRPEDAQDEVARLRSLALRLQEVTEPDERMQITSDIEALRASIFSQRDVMTHEGLVIDLVPPTDMVVSPDVVSIQSGWQQAEWIAQGVWLTPRDAAARFHLTETEMRTVRVYSKGAHDGDEAAATTDPTVSEAPGFNDGGRVQEKGFCRAWEIWHRATTRVLTTVDGLRRWARPPMRPERRPQCWYPFYCLAFNPIEDERYPLSDVELLAALQTEFANIRQKFMAHRDAVIPKTVLDGSRISATDAKKWEQAPVGSAVALEGGDLPAEIPLHNAFFVPDYPLPTPQLYDSAAVVGDMERVFGLGDAMRGSVAVPKTATEARQVQAATQGRMGERTSEIIALESRMANDAFEIMLQEIGLHTAREVAGASASWPRLDRKIVHQMVSVEVMHEGEADKERMQALWLELAPQIQSQIMTIAQLRAGGMNMIADPMVAILQETFRRYDDRIDVERFLPGGPHQAGQPMMPQLVDAAAGTVAPVDAQQLQMLQSIMSSSGMGTPGGGVPAAGASAGYNPAPQPMQSGGIG